MTKMSHSILPKKLNELSCQINKASDQLDDDPLSLQLIHADIETRFTFVKNLLAAETASHPTNQNHLEHLKERIEELEAVYRLTNSTHNLESTIDHVENNVAVVDDEDDDDHVSKCSICNESNVSDDEDYVDLDEEKKEMQVVVFDNAMFDVDRVVEDEFYDRVEPTFYDMLQINGASFENEEEKEEEKEARADVDVEETGEKKGEGLGFGKLWWAVVSGVVIGMVSVAMLESVEYDGYEGSLPFLTPT